MAADDELPRGWVQSSQPAENVQAAVLYPAVPGITWVVTAVNWSTVADNETITGQASIGIYPNNSLAVLCGDATLDVDTNWQTAAGSWSGLAAFGIGVPVYVQYSGGLSGAFERINASAYPI
jgi:hypothetical protein